MASLITGQVLAHGPTPQKIDESVTIAASPSEVWEVIGQFENIANWHPQVINTALTDDGYRRLRLENGEQLTESLDYRDEQTYAISYRLMEENFAAIPVSFYTITLQAEPTGDNQSLLTWSGRFYRADTGNFPPEELNDEAAVAAMTAYAKAGLQGIKDAVNK